MRHRTTDFRVRLGVETLETRQMLSGVSAVLDHGVLTVTGASDSSSPIHIWRQANQIEVDGVAGSFAQTQVKSIRVECGQSGDQTVNLGTGATSGQAALARPVTIDSGSGNETVLLGPTNIYFAGLGHQLAVSSTGMTQLDGARLDWFSTHVRNAAIRSLATTSFSDRVLQRSDMLAIFNKVEQQGVVTASELSDLQAIAGNTSLFIGVADVQNLTAKVVLGNPANAEYQGVTLGNLAAGSTATHLQLLVNKWFLGLDRPNTTVNHVTYAYAQASASLFPYAPVYTDICQGRLGDCYLLAGLAEIAVRNPTAIMSMFIVNGDGTYTVRFYNGRRADYVTVDSYLPEDADGKFVFANCGTSLTNPYTALWAPLAEKAYAEINEEGWLRTGGENSYASIAIGWADNVFTQVAALPATRSSNLNSAGTFAQFAAVYRAGSMLCFTSKQVDTDPQIVTNHVYAVINYNPTTHMVLVFNPWGVQDWNQKPGLVWLSWSQVVANYRSWSWSR